MILQLPPIDEYRDVDGVDLSELINDEQFGLATQFIDSVSKAQHVLSHSQTSVS
jgi:hypothetical protein